MRNGQVIKTTKGVLILLGGILTSSQAALLASESPSFVKVSKISYAGSGCPAGSVAENLSADFKAFTLIFDSYFAEVGPGSEFSQRRKNCQINVDLEFPQGWSFTIADIDYRGYAYLERGVSGLQKATYYFQGQRQSANKGTQFFGPFEGDYHARDTVGLGANIWSPCGARRALNINTQVRLENSQDSLAKGLLTTDSIDGTFETKFSLQWKKCW